MMTDRHYDTVQSEAFCAFMASNLGDIGQYSLNTLSQI